MIPSGVEIFVGLAPIDLRWGFDRLAGIVQEQVGRPAHSGALLLFFGERRRSMDPRSMSVFVASPDTFRPTPRPCSICCSRMPRS